MHKRFAITIAIVFLLSSGAFAEEIGQYQGFVIGASNIGNLTGAGASGISSITMVPVANFQQVVDGSGTLKTVQMGVASLFQGGTATGACGLYGFDQGASIVGAQSQMLPNYLSLGVQEQSLGPGLSQNVYRMGNLGSAIAFQNFVGGQNQLIITPYGVNANVQYVGVGLLDGIGGNASSMFNRTLTIDRTIIW